MMEAELRAQVERLGWSPEDLESRLPGPLADGDPAREPRVFERLEILLDLIELEIRPEGRPDSPFHLGASSLPERQTLSAQADRGALGTETVGRCKTDRQTLSARGRERWIVLRLPPRVLTRWRDLSSRIRHIRGPLPEWAVLTLVIDAARTEWLRLDPDSRPREYHALERDGWRCRAPGCTARRALEVHHIRFRSRGGPDTPDNKITLCHGHHRRGIHALTAGLEGRAPAGLRWRLGRSESAHAENFRGEHRTTPRDS